MVRLPQGGPIRIRVEPRGARRLEATNLLDLCVEQAWRVPGRGRLALFLDVFNLANRGVATSVADTSGPVFGWPSTWTDPRTLHAGLRFTF